MVAQNDETNELSPKQEAAMLALLSEPTITRAAEKADVGERTLHRWLREPAFSAEYRQRRREAFGQAISLTQRYAALAVNTLAQVLTDTTASHHAKVSAAAALLRLGRDGIELDDLAARIEALEQRADKVQRW